MAKKSQSDSIGVARLILYVRDIAKVAAFYEKHFGFEAIPSTEKGWLELHSASKGTSIALHQASSGQKHGSEIKIVFGVRDVHAFKASAQKNGLKFGVVHEVNGFEYSNAKDPAGNSISISSRGLK